MTQPVRGSNPSGAANSSAFHSPAIARALVVPTAPHKLEITYDTKPGNSLEIRGTASGMTWDAGKALEWNAGNKWTLELPAGTKPFEYKVVFVRNDRAFLFEEGANRTFDSNNRGPLKTPTFKEPAADFAAFAVKSAVATRPSVDAAFAAATGTAPAASQQPQGRRGLGEVLNEMLGQLEDAPGGCRPQ